jgi:hypothetical protein
MKIFATTPLFHFVRVPRRAEGMSSIASSIHRADDGNRQENPPKYYHSVRGDFDGLTE